MPFDDASFDGALALLVLHFVPDSGKAVAEMRRVVRRGGVVAAVAWSHLGGMPGMRMMVDTVAALSESGRRLRSRYCFQPMIGIEKFGHYAAGHDHNFACQCCTNPTHLDLHGKLIIRDASLRVW